eukprot:sb/3465891/
MSEENNDSSPSYLDYTPGSALASIDAKIAEMKALMNKVNQSAARILKAQLGDMPRPTPSPTSLLTGPATLDSIAAHLSHCKNVIVLTGAGISTSAGIPDFRTPGTGVYDNVQWYLDKYNVDNAMELFSYKLFQEDPVPFYSLCKDVKYPAETAKPTLAHYFIRLLSDKGVLLRNYTQNIDMLQSKTGIPDEKVFEVHGSFRSGRCTKCSATYTEEELKEYIMSGEVGHCTDCEEGGVIKPGIVMFGEPLPNSYICKISGDEGKCDLLIVMGTSLSVGPVNQIPNCVPPSTPRLLLNMEKVCVDESMKMNLNAPMFFFDHPDNKTDVFLGGPVDESVRVLAEKVRCITAFSFDHPNREPEGANISTD